ncbi:MAG: hypothetical protein QGG54_08125, partial [Gammaproteobacteria bacterium]|nr:hypothetical protein [Gammaproteobacteria bacterium]
GIADRRALSDPERELTPAGVAENRCVVKKFFLQSPVLTKCVVSPYARARQTAADFLLTFPNLEFEVSDLITPNGNPYEIMNFIDENQQHSLIMISHNPLLSNLLSLLVDGTIETTRQINTSTVVCVLMDVVAPGCGEIKYALEP